MKTTLLALAIALASNATTFAQAKAEDLKTLMTTLQAAITAGKVDEAAKTTAALLPDKARLQKALADGASAEVMGKIEGIYASIPKEPAQLAKLLAGKPNQTEIQVHGATTEEIAANAPGSVANKEFPGAVTELAKKGILRAGVTFYEVELLEPGKDTGMKYHLFFHDGANWTMLGPIWRAAK